LVSALAEIYQTRLDFTREIQAGDSYRLVYERERRPDGTARRRRILIAEVENRGLSYPAVFFTDNEDVHGYCDLKGKSVESGFSRYPIRYVRITSNFNPRRYHPVLGQYRAHLGTDYGAPHGEPVLATADGVITFQGRNGGYGNMVELRHANGYTTRYAHLSRFAKGQSRGTKVLKGQVMGTSARPALRRGPTCTTSCGSAAARSTRAAPSCPMAHRCRRSTWTPIFRSCRNARRCSSVPGRCTPCRERDRPPPRRRDARTASASSPPAAACGLVSFFRRGP